MLNKVLESGEATLSVDVPLTPNRCGFLETAYFTWSYSPIPNDVGSIGGVLLVTQETTKRVLAERRMQTLREMATETAGAETVEQGVCDRDEQWARVGQHGRKVTNDRGRPQGHDEVGRRHPN